MVVKNEQNHRVFFCVKKSTFTPNFRQKNGRKIHLNQPKNNSSLVINQL